MLSSVVVKLESSSEISTALSWDRTPNTQDVGDVAGVIFSLFLELRADSNVVFILITADQPWHKFCYTVTHDELI